MNNPETLAILGTQDTEEWTIQRHWQHWVHKTQRNEQSRDTGSIGYTRHRGMNNPETLAHWVHKTQRNEQSRDTGNIEYTRHRGMDNPETLATLGTQDTEE